jgi:hypothetical protein
MRIALTSVVSSILLLSMLEADARLLAIPNTFMGTPIFDRWGGCYFACSGSPLFYISDASKHSLRPYSGRFIGLYVSRIYKIMSPGDIRFDSFTVKKDPPSENPVVIGQDLEVSLSSTSTDANNSKFNIAIRNNSSSDIDLAIYWFRFVILAKRPNSVPLQDALFSVADGPSHELIGGTTLRDPWHAESSYGTQHVSWRIDKIVRESFLLAAKQTFEVVMDVSLTEGEYELFLFCADRYQHPKPLFSNRIAIDVLSDGTCRFPQIK